MTTEDDFQALLDADPDDHATRLILADFLDERGDQRGPGYRALGRNRFRPVVPAYDECWSFPGWQTAARPLYGPGGKRVRYGKLPDDWLEAVVKLSDQEAAAHWRTRRTRREAEDAAALAFGKLPAERQAELLAAKRQKRAMTSEDDFQARLAAKPHDWQTRLVFADWLQDRGDPRAEGYRALGVLRRRTYRDRKRHWWTAEGEGPPTYNHLPPDWFEALAGYKHRDGGDRWRWPEEWDESRDNRREIEDAAALAFDKLPAARRAELLAAEKPTAKRKPRSRAKKAKPATPKPKTKPKAAARKPKPKPRRRGEKS